jgi:hypothetical protein
VQLVLGQDASLHIRDGTATTCGIGMTNVLHNGEDHIHRHVVCMVDMRCGPSAMVRRVDHIDEAFALPLLPQCVQAVVRPPDGHRHEVQRAGGCLLVVQDDANDEGENECALLIAPATTQRIDQLVLLLSVVGDRLLSIMAMLTGHGCHIGPVGVMILLSCRPARAVATTTVLSLFRSEPSVVCVLLHDEEEMDDSLWLNASVKAAHRARGIVAA